MSNSIIDPFAVDDPLALDFDPSQVRVATFEPLPAGWYRCSITKIEARRTRDQRSVQAVVEFLVDDDAHRGRRLWAYLTMRSTRDDESGRKMIEIGQQQISQLLAACGVGGASLTPCIGRDVEVKVKVRPPVDGHDASNSVVGFRPCSSSTGGDRSPTTTSTGHAPTSTTSSMPSFMTRK